METKPPKVFVSHASEDKERFVNHFAESLRKNGVDAWVDKWEILPGDSLVDKIFEEGLKQAEAVIIILSQNSVFKPWVHNELNTAVVNRISKGTKIIPVILDDCEVPESLTSTLWSKIDDLQNYDQAFELILASIFNKPKKPLIGKPPEYVTQEYKQVNHLNKIDNLVFKAIYEYFIENDDYLVESNKVFIHNQYKSIPDDEINESMLVLENEGMIDTIGSSQSCTIKSTVSGLHEYCEHYMGDYQELINKCCGLILNMDSQTNNFELQEKLKISIVVVNNILKLLKLNDYINVSENLSGRIQVMSFTPMLKRAMIE